MQQVAIKHPHRTYGLPVNLWAPPSPTKTGGSGPYLSNRACEETLKSACRALGVTGYRLSQFLGMLPENYCRWFNGSTRPSPKYMSRLSMLLVFKSFGLDFRIVQGVNWAAGMVIFYPGCERAGENGKDSIFSWMGFEHETN